MADLQHPEISLMSAADAPTSTKDLRACLRCKLVKTYGQFREKGCDNCIDLMLEGDSDKIMRYTTPKFQGTLAMFDPSTSWVARWQKQQSFVPGVYALQAQGDIVDDEYEQEDELVY